MARSRNASESDAERFQVPAERPEDSFDSRTADEKRADAKIESDYPEKTDDVRKDESEPAAEPDADSS